ncbi:MAG: beta-galactosidase [Kiritimatiellia bacterium]
MRHVFAVFALFALSVHAGDFLATHKPTFWHGAEFPGATGSVACADGTLTLAYDFSKGGHYVSAQFALPERPVTRTISLETDFADDTELTLRIIDATGQTFQKHLPGAPEGWDRIDLAVDGGSWAGGWGGAHDHVFHQPATGFAILAENLTPDRPDGAVGVIRVRNVELKPTATPEQTDGCPLPGVPLFELMCRVGAARADLRQSVPELERRGLGAKSRATLETLENFIPWMERDLVGGFTNRVLREARELAVLGARGAARARAILAGEVRDFPVPHYKTSKIDISHAQMIADRAWPDGHVDRGPVFLTGYGHFSTIQRDLAKMPPLGNHILQMEIGPRSVLTAEGTVNTNALNGFFKTAARAAQENVAVTLLLSPHYFPDWAFKKWPHLKACSGGFLKYCVYDANAKAVVEKFLRAVVPAVRGTPALHSLCLSNEPETHVYAGCPVLRREWPLWLARRHGDIAAFNAKMKTSFASFEEVPMPETFKKNPPSAVLAEFQRFNTEMFAGWHQWMADIVHELAPEIPVHAKIMINPCFDHADNATFYSVDPALFGRLSQYNGNDSYDNYRTGGNGWGWSHNWMAMQAGYDWQRSAADIPVFNSENHIQPDRSKGYLPGSHTYTVLWQNAIHGQAATTLWCWERAYDAGKSDFNGLILERPEAFEAWAHAALDLSRLADVLAPIQNLPPSVLVYWSPAAVLRGDLPLGEVHRCYRAANFLGQPLGFATDAQLTVPAAARPLDQARVILVLEKARVAPDVQVGLDRFAAAGGRVVRVPLTKERELARWLATEAAAWNLPKAPLARDPATGLPSYGVETRGYRRDDKAFLSLCNHSRRTQKVQIEAAGTNLITGEAVPAQFTIEPLKPMLVEINPSH